MERIEIPKRLNGRWKHVLIMTFGCDLAFFENGLLRQFSSLCSNKILIVDGHQYLKSVENYVQNGYVENHLIRHVNRHYLVENVFLPHAFHPKLILLGNEREGRLLVGSGNISHQGYVSGGEIFAEYNFDFDNRDEQPSFIAVREFIEQLMQRDYFSNQAEEQIQYMFQECGWIYGVLAHSTTIRHNLQTSFLEQLKMEIASRSVEELSILVPFYDEKLIALEKLLDEFNPQSIRILLQKNRTSVGAERLREVLEGSTNTYSIYFVSQEDNPYIHAKYYLFKLSDSAICLQGSPNLSQVAMTLAGNHANIELANLLVGEREEFDDIINHLILEDITRKEAIEVEFIGENEGESVPKGTPRLLTAEWAKSLLTLRFSEVVKSFENTSIVIDDIAFECRPKRYDGVQVVMELPHNALQYLDVSRPVAVCINWADGTKTEPIFVHNIKALKQALSSGGSRETLRKFSDFDVDDEVLEQLLYEIKETLVIDGESAWHLAKSTGNLQGNVSQPANDDYETTAYEDIDFDSLMQHPRVKQYLRSRSGQYLMGNTRLETLLKSISASFTGLIDKPFTLDIEIKQLVDADDAFEIDDMDELEEEAEQQEERQQSIRNRTRNALKQFIKRFKAGIKSPLVHEKFGYEVVSHNYIVFVHLLWHLLAQELLENDFLLDAIHEILVFFWGDEQAGGYYHKLDEDTQTAILLLLQEQHNSASLLSVLYYYWEVKSKDVSNSYTIQMRDLWRTYLSTNRLPFDFDTASLLDASTLLKQYMSNNQRQPSQIVQGLIKLANFNDRPTLINELKSQFSLDTCRFEQKPVHNYHHASQLYVKCDSELTTYSKFLEVLHYWKRFETFPHYQIATDDPYHNRVILVYEPKYGKSERIIYRNNRTDEEREEDSLPSFQFSWDSKLDILNIQAGKAEQKTSNDT